MRVIRVTAATLRARTAKRWSPPQTADGAATGVSAPSVRGTRCCRHCHTTSGRGLGEEAIARRCDVDATPGALHGDRGRVTRSPLPASASSAAGLAPASRAAPTRPPTPHTARADGEHRADRLSDVNAQDKDQERVDLHVEARTQTTRFRCAVRPSRPHRRGRERRWPGQPPRLRSPAQERVGHQGGHGTDQRGPDSVTRLAGPSTPLPDRLSP